MEAHEQLRIWISEFLLAYRSAGRSPHTTAQHRSNLNQLCRFAEQRSWTAITINELRAYVAHLQERRDRYCDHPTRPTENGKLSVYTIIAHVRSIRRLFNWLVAEGAIEKNPAARLEMPRSPANIPRGITFEDVMRLMVTATNNRDRALLWVLFETGCRISEICGLRWSDIQMEQGHAQVWGKGQQMRFVFLKKPVIDALRVWQSEQEPAGEYVFTRLNGRPGPLTPNGANQILRRLKKVAGVTDRSNPHSFRHGFAREWLMNGGDLPSLKDEMGHRSIVSTMIYSGLPLPERREQHRLYSPADRLSRALVGLEEGN